MANTDKYIKDLEDTNALNKDEIRELSKENKELKKKINEYENLLIEIKTEREVLARTKQKTWEEKVIDFTGVLPFKIGMILRFLLTPPVSRYFFMLIFALMVVASFIGWDGVADGINTITGIFD